MKEVGVAALELNRVCAKVDGAVREALGTNEYFDDSACELIHFLGTFHDDRGRRKRGIIVVFEAMMSEVSMPKVEDLVREIERNAERKEMLGVLLFISGVSPRSRLWISQF